MRCPQCNSDQFINISPSVWLMLLSARLFPSRAPDWHASSASAAAVGSVGLVADFKIKETGEGIH